MSTSAQQKPAAQNLTDLYKPVGIQAVSAAAMCFKGNKTAAKGK